MPGESRTLVPLYRIQVNGKDLDPVEADAVHQIKITDFLRLPDICTVQVGYQADTEGGEPVPEARRLRVRGRRDARGQARRHGGPTTKTIFKGEIVTVEPDFQAGGVSMVVRAYDQSHRMMRSRKQRTFVKEAISDIVASICRSTASARR